MHLSLGRKLIATTFLSLSCHAQATDIIGAGASFPYPLYAKWAEVYKQKTGTGLNYQSIGSGGGIKQIQAKTVDFGASDAPMKPEELVKNGLYQFPTVMGGVVPVYNLPGVAVGQLKLTPTVLADIYLGKIKNWNDPAIAALNKGVALPDLRVNIVRRADGSGTTFIFTNYLSKVSADWKAKVGEGTAVAWPAGIGGKGNEGVAAYVQRLKGAIGYVEYAYAKRNKLSYVTLQNREGVFIEPNEASFKAAATYADWKNAPGFYEILTNEPGKDSWPIVGATFILMHKKQDKLASAKDVLKFFEWAYSAEGDKLSMDLDYIPMPEEVVTQIKASWKQMTDANGASVLK
ncbi:phosphate ABC transporter substrate-binding protein PstS [Chitinimonas sp. BJB300]|uniref:phosphate ABC transporter substrate-binding protein PstS n=1 Tax=Chitinimonas sp. BJB300 TaxID=1559339 RepID=UPI000C0FAEAC|nr:phosphate ABC transporter substrate-binding protein PstS [Chitinimonas sp. BJB300]PHV10787.1 phosphate ABC transporter substrate-binding protein PstS [Chitinimonas sp. BJB300]TSJ87806.1 phosphate ABC transporter substrate-binding protein PstS [Chitinimonas sp. BJB300]